MYYIYWEYRGLIFVLHSYGYEAWSDVRHSVTINWSLGIGIFDMFYRCHCSPREHTKTTIVVCFERTKMMFRVMSSRVGQPSIYCFNVIRLFQAVSFLVRHLNKNSRSDRNPVFFIGSSRTTTLTVENDLETHVWTLAAFPFTCIGKGQGKHYKAGCNCNENEYWCIIRIYVIITFNLSAVIYAK